MDQADEQLISRCLRGDEAAWEEVYRRYYGRVKRVIGWKRWGFSPIEVEDGVQEVFLQLVRALPRFRGEASLATFLTRLARNRCISHLRKKTALKRGREELGRALDGPEDERPRAPAVESGPGPEEAVMAEEEARQVAEALDRLSDDCQVILRLRYYRQMSYKEICQALGLPLGTVCSRLKRCLARLHREMEVLQPIGDNLDRDPGARAGSEGLKR